MCGTRFCFPFSCLRFETRTRNCVVALCAIGRSIHGRGLLGDKIPPPLASGHPGVRCNGYAAAESYSDPDKQPAPAEFSLFVSQTPGPHPYFMLRCFGRRSSLAMNNMPSVLHRPQETDDGRQLLGLERGWSRTHTASFNDYSLASGSPPEAVADSPGEKSNRIAGNHGRLALGRGKVWCAIAAAIRAI